MHPVLGPLCGHFWADTTEISSHTSLILIRYSVALLQLRIDKDDFFFHPRSQSYSCNAYLCGRKMTCTYILMYPRAFGHVYFFLDLGETNARGMTAFSPRPAR